MKRVLLLCLVLWVLSGSTLAEESDRRVIIPSQLDLGLPFSPGIQKGKLLYISGTIGNRPGLRELPAGIEAQTRQTLENIRAVLNKAGMKFSDVISANVYLADSRHYDEMNRVYQSYFPEDPPARATVEADIVISGALIEVSMIAAQPETRHQVILPPGWPTPGAPYSWGVVSDDTLHVSGTVGLDPSTGQIAGDDVSSQTRQAFANIGAILKAAQLSFRDVVSTRVYLSDARDFSAMNTVFRSIFPNDPPVRATVRARLANPDLKVEIQSIAVRGSGKQFYQPQGSSLPFSTIAVAGDTIYLAGMVGRGPDGLAAGDLRSQASQTIRNLRLALEQVGSSLDEVVEASVYLSDVRYYNAMNTVYRELMPQVFPARATVGTLLMSPEALIEIKMTARRP